MGDASRLRRAGAALVSLACLLALVGAVPLALWTMIGWPLPAGVPSPRQVGDALTQSDVPDSTLLKAIALVGWIAWLQVAASVIVEVAAWVRGRPARRLRFASVVQPAMRRLVASAALLLGGTHALEATTFVPAQRAPVVAEAQHVDAQPIAETTPSTTPSTASDTPAIAKVHTVVRYDTLWGLAETHLGDAFRWREIYELNRGVRQPDGRGLEDPDLIIPGWTLTFPADAVGVDEAAPTAAPDAVAVAAALELATYEVPDTSTCPAPRPNGATHVTPESSPRTTATHEVPESAADRSDSESDHTTNAMNPALLIGGGLGAAALVALLDRLRRAQRRRRRQGTRPRSPRAELEQIERKLRHAADLDEAELLDLALRAFSAGVLTSATEAPRLLAVRLHYGRVELLLDRTPARVPDGFVMTDDERGWITEPDVTEDRLRALGNGAGAPCPGLVSLGDLEGGRLLIDIETAGILTIEGEPERVAALIRRMAIELATSTWVDHVDVIAVGTMDVDVAGAQRVRGVRTLHAALDDLAASARAIGEALDSALCENTSAARISVNHDDGWMPTILVCSEPIDSLALDRLRAITGDGRRGVGAVVQSTTRASWHAVLHDDELLLTPHGFHIAPAVLDAETARSLDELLTEAVVDAADQALDEPAPNGAKPARTIAAPYEDPPFDIEVRVLGPVEVVGTPHDLDGPRAIELAAYLALHPDGVSDERLKTVLWPNAQPSTATFNTAVSRLRSRLGHGRDDAFHLLHVVATGGVYRLGLLVTTDVARFEARVAHARTCGPSAAIETLRSAFSLVRGKPFDCKRGYEWAFSEGTIANLEASIADAAHDLAKLCLDAIDPQGATWAAMQGLIAAPGDEILYRDRMLACDLAGNPAGVETVMDELCEVVEALEPYDELHPETLALYERLSHRKRTRTG